MSADTFTSIMSLGEHLSASGLLIFFIVGGWKGWWVWQREYLKAEVDRQREYAKLEADRDWWKARSINNTELVRSAVKVAEKVIAS